MKPVQVSFDDRLLEQLDADDEVRRLGRSAVLRRAVEMYLDHRRRSRIVAAYKAAYADAGTPADLSGWEDEGEWPEP
jgi:metal-responsive CopG/Arc/MetJ family transcriptional regulator